MQSYKNWKLVNESHIPGMTLGLGKPQKIGGLRSNSIDEKKKNVGEVVVDNEDDVDDEVEETDDEECSCKDKKKKEEPEVKYSKKKMKDKKECPKKKHMEDDLDDDEMKHHDDENLDGEDHDDHDGDDDDMDDDHDEDDMDDDDDLDGDHDEDEMDDDDHDEDDDDMDDDEGEDTPKFGFMKDKKDKKDKKEKKLKKVQEENFWHDINANYLMPNTSEESDEDFSKSLARQYGNPKVKFNGGVDSVNEDLLLSPEQQALIDNMPQAGEVGYSPVQRMGDFGSSRYEEADESDYEVLCKYFNESVARQLIEKKKNS